MVERPAGVAEAARLAAAERTASCAAWILGARSDALRARAELNPPGRVAACSHAREKQTQIPGNILPIGPT